LAIISLMISLDATIIITSLSVRSWPPCMPFMSRTLRY
jgi:hypothetical protein